MEKLLKNKTLLIIFTVILIIAAVGAYFLLNKKDNSTSQQNDSGSSLEVKPLKPSDIGLELTPKKDGKVITLSVNKLDGISSIEYDVSYDAQVTEDGESVTVPRGVAGSPLEVRAGEKSLSRDLDLGTCSRNVCKYDNVVGKVKFTIRVNYSDGTVGAIETSIDIN